MGDSGEAASSTGDVISNERVTGILKLCVGEDVPQQIQLSGKTKTFGRAVNNDVVCNCLQISRKHAAFEYVNNKWFLKDMSTNGLSINGQKIDKGVASELFHNDVIMFIPTGALQYQFESVDTEALPRTNPSNIASNLHSPVNLQSSNDCENNNLRSNIPKPPITPISLQDEDDYSNHSESLLVEDIREIPLISIPNYSESTSTSTSSGSSPGKTNQYCNQKLSNKETRVKRPYASAEEPGSSSAKRKFLNDFKCSKIKEEEEQELPDIEDFEDPVVDILSEVQELPDLDEPYFDLPIQKKIQVTSSTNDFSLGNDVAILQKQILECRKQLKNKEAEIQIQLIEKDIEYQKLQDKFSESESKAEVQKEEVFKRVMDAMERELGCCICNEIFIEATVIECGHTFCKFCISEWVRRNPECPICRSPIRKQTKHKEMDNYIVLIHTIMSDEIRNKRESTLQDRAKAIEKAETDHLASARGRRGAIGDLADHSIIEFLSDMHMNQMFRVREISRPRRGYGRGTSSNRRSTRIQNLVGEVSGGTNGLPRQRGRQRRGARRGPVETVTTPNAASSSSNAEAPSLQPVPPANVIPAPSNPSVELVDFQQPGPSRFMGFLGMVQRAATSRVGGVNLFSSNPNPTAAASTANNTADANNVLPEFSGRIAPRHSDSVVLLSSDDDLELIDEALGSRRARRTRNVPLNIDFFGNSDYNTSGSSDEY